MYLQDILYKTHTTNEELYLVLTDRIKILTAIFIVKINCIDTIMLLNRKRKGEVPVSPIIIPSAFLKFL